MEEFITRCLKRIRGISIRRDKELRAACDDGQGFYLSCSLFSYFCIHLVLERLLAHREMGHMNDTDADKYWEPFRLACASKNSKVKEAALDCLQKLIGAFGE
jgi:hypothetical protein